MRLESREQAVPSAAMTTSVKPCSVEYLRLCMILSHARARRCRATFSCYVSARRFFLFVSVRNPPARQVVGRKVHRDPIPLQNPNVILAHLAADVRQHLVPVLELHAEGRVGKHFADRPHHLYRVASHARCRSPSPVGERGTSQANDMRIHGFVARRGGTALDVRRVTTASLD